MAEVGRQSSIKREGVERERESATACPNIMVEQRESESTIATRSAVRISIFCERGVGRDASATNEAAVPTGNVGRSVLRSRSARAWARTHLEMVD